MLGLTMLVIVLVLYLPKNFRASLATKGNSGTTSAFGVTQSVDTGSYFFRLKAHYSYGGERINFDIVVGCSVRVTRYRGGDSGFLAARYPRFFVHRTKDGHAVMQIVPIACRGETTENGIVPKDFLPGAIWFEKYGDYRFGIAYVSEDAFESPNGKLTFHGASIHRATQEELDAFRQRAAGNEGLRKRYYDGPYYSTEDGQRIAAGGGKEVEAAYARSCSGGLRYKLSKSAQALARKHWPAEKPRYWTPSLKETNKVVGAFEKLDRSSPIFADGFRINEHFFVGSYKYGGFPTRARGGMLHSRADKRTPPEFFPARDDRGAPWVFTERVARSKYLDKDIELYTGPGKGFLYCYTTVPNGEGGLEAVLPDYRVRPSRVQVDGAPVVTPEPRHWNWPSMIFENDEYLFFRIVVALS